MKKIKLFIENFLVYGIGGVISKIIPFIMLPIVTRLMPNSTYIGLHDLSNTVVEFGKALAILGMYDAMFRMFFEKSDKEYQTNVCSTAFFVTLFNSVIIFIIVILFRKQIALYFLGDVQYIYIIDITAATILVSATNNIVSAPTRIQNRRKIFLVTNTLSPILSYFISIPLILKGQFAVALPLGALVSVITMEMIFWGINHVWFQVKKINKKLLKTMLCFAIPTVPCFLVYWIFGSCDRIMINNRLGVAEAGIYTVGGRIGQISQLIYVAFAGGWQYFSFSTMKDKEQVKTNSYIFEYLGAIAFIAGAFMCAISYFVFKILFEEEYIQGYLVAPYLFLAPLLQMLEQVAGNQFLVVKKTWPSAFILGCGAATNIIFNHFLIPILGIEGAALGTLLGYVVSNVINIIVLCHMKLFLLSKRFLIMVAIFGLYLIIWRFFFVKQMLISLLIVVGIIGAYGFLYKNEIATLLSDLKLKR